MTSLVTSGDAPSLPELNRLSPVRVKARISDRVYDELLSAIRDLVFKPDAVLSETELSIQLGVSRTPLREAISRLADQGLVNVVPQVGTRVSLIDMSAVEEACFVRGALETAAFRLACSDGARDVSKLRAILLRQERAVVAEDSEAFFRTDEELHQEIFRLSGHVGAWNVILRSKLHLDRLRRLILPEVMSSRALVTEHTRIVDLLEAGDVEAGCELINEHSTHVIKQAPSIRAEYPDFFRP